MSTLTSINKKITPDGFVDHFYECTDEDLMYGRELGRGMVVLLADPFLRGDPAHVAYMQEHHGAASPFEIDKARENNRWCVITEVSSWPHHNIVRFTGLYQDGTKRVRTYGTDYGWLVRYGFPGAPVAAAKPSSTWDSKAWWE